MHNRDLRLTVRIVLFSMIVGPIVLHGPSEVFADHEIATMTAMNVISVPPDSAFFRVSSSYGPNGDTYGLGEIIEIEATFNRGMLVTGSGDVKMDLTVGDSTRTATYHRGSGTRKLVFRYEVIATDTDTDGISVPATAWRGSGTVKTSVSNFAAVFTPIGLETQSGHRVNGSLGPWVTNVEIASTPASGATYRHGEEVEIDVTYTAPVRVDSVDQPWLPYFWNRASDGTEQQNLAWYRSGTGTNTLRLSFTVRSEFKDTDGVRIGSAAPDHAGERRERIVWALNHDGVRAPWKMSGLDADADHQLNGEPYIKGVAVTSSPAYGATYRRTEAIRIAVTFDQNVQVEGAVTKGLKFTHGDGEFTSPHAQYASGNRTKALVFKHTVAEGDEDTDGLTVLAGDDGGWGGSGKIWSSRPAGSLETLVQADLGHGEIANADSHKVDGGQTLPVPAISSVELVTDPGDDSTYVAGDWIGARVTFDESVSVTGTPQLGMAIGTTERIARFGQGSFEGSVSPDDRTAGPEVVFGYQVQEGDLDRDGIAIGEDKLTLSGGAIKQAVTGVAADLSHDAVTSDAGHKVDAVDPVVSSIAISSRAGGDSLYVIGDSIQVTMTFSEEVTVSGAPQLELELGGEARTATYDFTGDSTAVFAYVVQEGDVDTDGIAIDADTLSLADDSAITDRVGNPAELAYGFVSADRAHRVEGVSPTLSSAEVLHTGSTVNLFFSEHVTVPRILYTIRSIVNVNLGQFFIAVLTVEVDGDQVRPSSASLHGLSLQLHLYPSDRVTESQRVKVSYDNIFARDAVGLFIDRAGNPLGNFGATSARNTSNRADAEEPDAGELVLSQTELRITEGETKGYTVALESQPSDSVTVAISSSSSKLSANRDSLTFTTNNWNAPQRVRLTANQDDDDLNYWVAVTNRGSGGGYDGARKWVLVVIDDDDGE
ncbi:MAG: hypothetical protein OYM47_02065 [Gemmatimonadota bacterium]|nr:hypothetical protein [Gemmatimonadota bacterium]